jgi:uncharacterized membrane protein YeiH
LGLGGGTARDVLRNLTPVALQQAEYLVAAVCAGLAGVILAERILRASLLYDLIDGVALGVYTMVGVTKALDVGLPYVGAIAIGGVAATAGGILRDVLMNELPSMMRPGPPYLTAALIGAAALVGADALGISQVISVPMAIALIVLLRLAALGLGWRTPSVESISTVVERAAQRGAASMGRAPADAGKGRAGPGRAGSIAEMQPAGPEEDLQHPSDEVR